MKTLRIALIACIILLLNIQGADAQWTQSNGPNGGEVTCLAASGTDLFAGTRYGLFLSTNNGTTWTEVGSQLTSMHILSIAVSGSNIFVGTFGGGVFLSSDNGTSWTTVNTGLTNPFVWTLSVSGTDILAGTSATNGGVFIYTNNGSSWARTGLITTSGHSGCFCFSIKKGWRIEPKRR